MSRADGDESTGEALLSFEKALGYRFSKRSSLETALTHRSYANEGGTSLEHNERLEFLGDAVLQLAITTELLARLPQAGEGHLSKLRASLVNARYLAQLARKMNLDKVLRVGRSLQKDANRFAKPSLLADGLEAVFGAIHQDRGYPAARKVIIGLFDEALSEVVRKGGALVRDHKTTFQEVCIRRFGEWPKYLVLDTEPRPNDGQYVVAVEIGGRRIAVGRGSSKKEAGQDAARQALEEFESGPRVEKGSP